MVNSYVENEFINCCKVFGEKNSYIISKLFIEEYYRYRDEYSPLIEQEITKLYTAIHNKNPNIHFSLRGRFKSKRSFLIKSFFKLAENIEKVFSGNYINEEESLNKFFCFISNNEYNTITTYLKNLQPESDPIIALNYVLSLLSEKDRNNLIRRLGRTEDTFAYKILVHSLDYDINNIQIDSTGKVSFVDSTGNIRPVHPSIKLNPNTDIHLDEYGLNSILSDTGDLIHFDEHNLLYDSSVTAANRNLKNAKKDFDGNITLLWDSFVIADGSIVDISDISYYYDFDSNSSYIKVNDITIQLSDYNKDHPLKIRKHDEATLIKATEEIDSIVKNFHKSSSFILLPYRTKNYIKKPKPSGYQSIHNSYTNLDYGYSMEGQEETLGMYINAKNEETKQGHDNYKRSKLKYKINNNRFISRVINRWC